VGPQAAGRGRRIVVESILYFVAGAALAGLIALMLVPALNARAERLYRRRLEAKLPRSYAEFVAAKDAVRAEMAAKAARSDVEARRLGAELVEAELARSEALVEARGLAAERQELVATIADLEARLTAAHNEKRELTERIARSEAERREIERQAASREEEAAAHSSAVETEALEMRQALSDAEARIASLTDAMRDFLADGPEASLSFGTETVEEARTETPSPVRDGSGEAASSPSTEKLRDAVMRLRAFSDQRRGGAAAPDTTEPERPKDETPA
jgi:hypothetical protein